MMARMMAAGDFTYTGLPARVVFGTGTLARAPSELERLGVARALVLTTPAQADHGRAVAARLGDRAAGVFSGAMMHTPVDVTLAALARMRELGAGGVVAIGGGSTIGLGKAIAVRTGVPQLAIPTTYAGSEMTPILGETEAGKIFKFGSTPGILIQTAEGEYRALSAICTHLDCTVQFRSDENLIWCACHNGRYDLNGKNISGPPPRPLEEFQVNVRGDDVVVSRG